MNVVSSVFRKIYIISLFLCSFHNAHSMVMDNRYFPWLDQLYTGSNSQRGNLSVEGFFLTGGDAYRKENKSDSKEQIVSFPELYGELKLDEVANSLVAAGKPNPIPLDWRWLADFKAKMNGSIEGQGVMISCYAPIVKHFGIGGSTLLMQLNSSVTVKPDESIESKLFLAFPGNQALFSQTLSDVYKAVHINRTTTREVAAGDTVVYGNFYYNDEYKYKMRTFDCGVWLGGIIPTGLKVDPYNLSSVPLGGNGLWGVFVAPRFELELKEDLRFGMHGRVTKRIGKAIEHRIPLDKEQPFFAPFVDNVHVTPGITASASAYVAFEDLQEGFGILAKYTASYHSQDNYSTNVLGKSLEPNFQEMKCRSSFVTEYATVKLFYDVGHNKSWKHKPVLSFTWDIPRNHIGGKAFAKTHRVSLNCTVNF